MPGLNLVSVFGESVMPYSTYVWVGGMCGLTWHYVGIWEYYD